MQSRWDAAFGHFSRISVWGVVIWIIASFAITVQLSVLLPTEIQDVLFNNIMSLLLDVFVGVWVVSRMIVHRKSASAFWQLMHIRQLPSSYFLQVIAVLLFAHLLGAVTGTLVSQFTFLEEYGLGGESLFLPLNAPGALLNAILAITLIVLIGPFVEELVFRGVFIHRLRRYMRLSKVIILSSVLFAAIHTNPEMLGFFLVGVLLCLVPLRSGSIVLPILLHIVNNLVALWALAIPVLWTGVTLPIPKGVEAWVTVMTTGTLVIVLLPFCWAFLRREWKELVSE